MSTMPESIAMKEFDCKGFAPGNDLPFVLQPLEGEPVKAFLIASEGIDEESGPSTLASCPYAVDVGVGDDPNVRCMKALVGKTAKSAKGLLSATAQCPYSHTEREVHLKKFFEKKN